VLDGFGTSANAFGVAAARRNGRFDHAYTLSSELVGTSWPLPDGTLLGPRAVSHLADAPYLGEAAILYFLTVPPAEGVPIVTGGHVPPLVVLELGVYFGMSALVLFAIVARVRRRKISPSRSREGVGGRESIAGDEPTASPPAMREGRSRLTRPRSRGETEPRPGTAAARPADRSGA
jgi:hypothetical protein